MTRLTVVLAFACVVAPVSRVGAQGVGASANPVADAVRRVLESESKHLIGSADLMPAEQYDYHPTPAQLTFGQLIAHVVQTNLAICSMLADTPSPLAPEALGKVKDVSDKATLAPLLRQSFDYCAQAMATLKDSSLATEAVMFGRPTGLSRAAALVTIATDWADHYSTAAGYLRLNNILPPSAQPPK